MACVHSSGLRVCLFSFQLLKDLGCALTFPLLWGAPHSRHVQFRSPGAAEFSGWRDVSLLSRTCDACFDIFILAHIASFLNSHLELVSKTGHERAPLEAL